MTNDYRLAHSELADRRQMARPLGPNNSLYRDAEDSSLTSLTLLRAGAPFGMTSDSTAVG
jgi:hypothetical protein